MILGAVNGKCSSGNGVCISTANCIKAGGSYVDNMCPDDPNDIKCCNKSRCVTKAGDIGSCMFLSKCTGTPYSDYCPGGTDFQCCVQNNTEGDPPSPPSNKSKTLIIIAIIVGVIVLLAIIILGVCLVIKNNNNKDDTKIKAKDSNIKINDSTESINVGNRETGVVSITKTINNNSTLDITNAINITTAPTLSTYIQLHK